MEDQMAPMKGWIQGPLAPAYSIMDWVPAQGWWHHLIRVFVILGNNTKWWSICVKIISVPHTQECNLAFLIAKQIQWEQFEDDML